MAHRTDMSDPSTWDPALDAVKAAPKQHKVIFENDNMRVLEVTLKPNDEEPMHHHRWLSVGFKDAGFGLFFWGIFATGVPMLLAPLIGKYIFRFDPAINLGCCGGARTSTASVAMVGENAKSDG